MRNHRGQDCETYHLTCPVCSALPGTSCIDEDYQELARVHPSRRVSVAERNRRWYASGWEPPELAERHRREHAERIAKAPLFDPRLGAGVTAALEGRKPRILLEPGRGPWNASGAARKVTPEDQKHAGMDGVEPRAERDVQSQLVAYLSVYARGAVVPRQILRDIASDALPVTASGPVPVSLSKRVRRRMAGLSGNSSCGSRSSRQLSAHLKRLEELDLIRRDQERDTVTITDPVGLRKLRDNPERAMIHRHGQPQASSPAEWD